MVLLKNVAVHMYIICLDSGCCFILLKRLIKLEI